MCAREGIYGRKKQEMAVDVRRRSLSSLHGAVDVRRRSLSRLHEAVDVRQRSLSRLHEAVDVRRRSLSSLHEAVDVRRRSLSRLHEAVDVRRRLFPKMKILTVWHSSTYASSCVSAGRCTSDAPMLTTSTATMKRREATASISRYSWISIFTPMNTSRTQTPTFR